ncbi:MAG: AraC family transcriptional regulator ligand-binding domain-containing protein, partial [Pseudomonas sp.]|uniref:AraC family transcriptional regulator ligand-binding domain-containing protein n=1 Tax=Pseudomonas sp. TaxID=306 RepID=UPI003BB631FA
MLHAHLTTLHVVAQILELFAGRPELSEALLAGSGIAPADLHGGDSRITRTQELQVCTPARALRADLGLALGQRLHVSSYGLLGYAALSSATFGDAWRLLLQYPALLGTYFKLDLSVEGELAWVNAAEYRHAPALEQFNVEMCLASLRLIGDELMRAELANHLAEPPGLEALAQQMHCSPRSLRRHLQELGTHYQELLDELRFERAKTLLGQED